jgi:hypothetical protein
MKVEAPSVLLLTISSFGLKVSIVLVVDLFKTRSSSALVMLNVIDFPLIAQVPPIVPVTPWPSVLLMKPTGRTWATKLPLALNEMDSLMSPTTSSNFSWQPCHRRVGRFGWRSELL